MSKKGKKAEIIDTYLDEDSYNEPVIVTRYSPCGKKTTQTIRAKGR